MVLELIFSIILIGSSAGFVFMIVRKLPQLRATPMEESSGPSFLSRLRQRIKQNGFVRDFSWRRVLEKLLLRTEKQTNCWLKKLEEQTAIQKAILSDDYWKELKKSTRLASSISIGEDESEEVEEVKIKVKTGTGRRRKKEVS